MGPFSYIWFHRSNEHQSNGSSMKWHIDRMAIEQSRLGRRFSDDRVSVPDRNGLPLGAGAGEKTSRQKTTDAAVDFCSDERRLRVLSLSSPLFQSM
jgi:hypothetical protein